MRLLKLFYYTVVEHVRSTDGGQAWAFAQKIAYSFATPAEVSLLTAEFGAAQPSGRAAVVSAKPPDAATAYIAQSHTDHGGLAVTSARLENRAKRSDELCQSNGLGTSQGESSKPQDPTQGKPLVVLMWLRLALRKLERRSGE